jgi:hypothetical protein
MGSNITKICTRSEMSPSQSDDRQKISMMKKSIVRSTYQDSEETPTDDNAHVIMLAKTELLNSGLKVKTVSIRDFYSLS